MNKKTKKGEEDWKPYLKASGRIQNGAAVGGKKPIRPIVREQDKHWKTWLGQRLKSPEQEKREQESMAAIYKRLSGNKK